MKERWEMDLSPGIRMSPESAVERRAVAGFGDAEWDMDISLSHLARGRAGIGDKRELP